MKQVAINMNFQVFSPEEFFDKVMKEGRGEAYRMYHTDSSKVTSKDVFKVISNPCSHVTYYEKKSCKGEDVIHFYLHPVNYTANKQTFCEKPNGENWDKPLSNAHGCAFLVQIKN